MFLTRSVSCEFDEFRADTSPLQAACLIAVNALPGYRDGPHDHALKKPTRVFDDDQPGAPRFPSYPSISTCVHTGTAGETTCMSRGRMRSNSVPRVLRSLGNNRSSNGKRSQLPYKERVTPLFSLPPPCSNPQNLYIYIKVILSWHRRCTV